MTKLEISSTGMAGVPDYYRSEGRAYLTLDQKIYVKSELIEQFHCLKSVAQSTEYGRRRTVMRAVCSNEVASQLLTDHTVPLEVVVPLQLINQEDGYLVVLAENIHDSSVPEWPDVYAYWQQPVAKIKPPQERVNDLTDAYTFINQPNPGDVEQLTKIWRLFGWTQAGVESFIHHFTRGQNVWFSGVRESNSGRLVSACLGEALEFGELTLVEGTEYGTLAELEGRGLCTAAVCLLHAQILADTYYATGNLPLVIAEFDMSSRSDIVGRKTGMTIPLVEGTENLSKIPLQVLRYNVSVLDRRPPNHLKWRDLNGDRGKYRQSYRTKFRYWRNFILGVLPKKSVEQFYSPTAVESLMSLIAEEQP